MLRTSLSPGACAERLESCVMTGLQVASLARMPLAGSVTPEGFDVWWRSGHRVRVAPVAKGRFETDPAGTVIQVRIRMSLGGWVLVMAWVAFALVFGSLQFGRALMDPRASAAERLALAIRALGPSLVMLTLFGAGVVAAGWIHRRDADHILDTLMTALDAEPGTDFRPVT